MNRPLTVRRLLLDLLTVLVAVGFTVWVLQDLWRAALVALTILALVMGVSMWRMERNR